MRTTPTRLVAVTAATLALVAGAGAAVSAQPGADDPFALDRGRSWIGERIGQRDMFRPGRGAWHGDIAGRFDGFVRQETTYEDDDGLVTRRLDNGTLLSATDGAVEYSLADGQVVSAVIGEDTEVIAFEEELVELGRGGLLRRQLSSQSVDPADLGPDSDILVWAESQEDGTFLAQRIVVQPVDDSTDEGDMTDAATSDSSANESEDAPASPAAVSDPASA